tara:strand:+ start:1530 stop:1799 length:270 start_codon:yes stop_codon:yes gene_type:complete
MKFYKYMKDKYGKSFTDKDKVEAFDTLLELIGEMNESDNAMSTFIELTLLNKTDRLIYRNTMAVLGTELTPVQLDQYISTIEYALEYIS